jgi:undecaprenyl-diphosphatase
MTIIDAIILGIVQGLTEFFPVSSSGHLQLIQYFLGLKQLDHYLLFDLVCHFGTLLAVIFAFFKPIQRLFKEEKKKLGQIILATLPLFPLVILIKPIKSAYSSPGYLGFFFLLTACILFLGIRFGKQASEANIAKHSWRDAFVIGLWQALAILPGVSRSGSTISGARLLGWTYQEAVSFSFLLSIPAILGGTALELFKFWHQSDYRTLDLSFLTYFTGFVISFGVGLGALQLFMWLTKVNKLSFFAWYCLFLGISTTWYFH